MSIDETSLSGWLEPEQVIEARLGYLHDKDPRRTSRASPLSDEPYPRTDEP